MQSKAATVSEYLSQLPDDRRAAIESVRKVILKNLDREYEEGMQYGMIGYYVPHRVFPPGYHCDPKQPLPFAGLASQKNHMSLYVMSLYGENVEEKWFRESWAKTGKKLDMGKCCIRFKKLDDLPLDLIGETIRRVPAQAHIAQYQANLASRSGAPKRQAAKSSAASSTKMKKKSATKKTAHSSAAARSKSNAKRTTKSR